MGIIINACLMLAVPMFICIKKFNMSFMASFCLGLFIFLYDKIVGVFVAGAWFSAAGTGVVQSLLFIAFYLATQFAGIFAIFFLVEKDSYVARGRALLIFGYVVVVFIISFVLTLVASL